MIVGTSSGLRRIYEVQAQREREVQRRKLHVDSQHKSHEKKKTIRGGRTDDHRKVTCNPNDMLQGV